MKFKIASVDSLIIYFGDIIDDQIALNVKKAYLCLKKLNLEGIIEIIPSYTSIFISFDIFKYDFQTLSELIKKSINLDSNDEFEEKIVTIDVYYGQDVGLDLYDMSLKTNVSIEKIIEMAQYYDLDMEKAAGYFETNGVLKVEEDPFDGLDGFY